MKKILFVFHNSDLLSGATHSLIENIDLLLKTGKYDIYAVFPYREGSASEYLKNKNIPVFIFKYGNLMRNFRVPIWKKILKFPIFLLRHFFIYIQSLKAAQFFNDYDFDIVYSNTSCIIFGGLLGKKLSCKQIWHIHEFRTVIFYLGEKWMKKFIQKNANAVLCVGQVAKEYQTDVISREKMFVTYNSFTRDLLCPREKFNENGSLTLLIAGDIKLNKGQFEAVEAVKILNEKYKDKVILNLAGKEGEPEYVAKMKKYIAQNHLEKNVKFLGFCTDMKSVRKNADIGLVPFKNEAFGRTTIEGMLSMMAMIGRDSGETSNLIKNGKTGFLYDGSVLDLVKCISKLVENRSLMKQIAKAGFEDAEKYTSGYAAKVTERTIDAVLEGRL